VKPRTSNSPVNKSWDLIVAASFNSESSMLPLLLPSKRKLCSRSSNSIPCNDAERHPAKCVRERRCDVQHPEDRVVYASLLEPPTDKMEQRWAARVDQIGSRHDHIDNFAGNSLLVNTVCAPLASKLAQFGSTSPPRRWSRTESSHVLIKRQRYRLYIVESHAMQLQCTQ